MILFELLTRVGHFSFSFTWLREIKWLAQDLSTRKYQNCDLNLCLRDGGSDGKVSTYNAGDPDSVPGLGRSPGEGKGNPLQYFRLKNPMDRGACRAIVHGVARVGYDLATKP